MMIFRPLFRASTRDPSMPAAWRRRGQPAMQRWPPRTRIPTHQRSPHQPRSCRRPAMRRAGSCWRRAAGSRSSAPANPARRDHVARLSAAWSTQTAKAACSAWPFTRTGPRPARCFVSYTTDGRLHGVARFPPDPRQRHDAGQRHRAGPADGQPAVRPTTTAATSPSARTATCTSGSATAAAAATRRTARRTRTRLLGKMLRIDVARRRLSRIRATRIPADNPFAANPKCGPGNNAQACPEIYAWGLRNPWRCSFDAATGRAVGRRCRPGCTGKKWTSSNAAATTAGVAAKASTTTTPRTAPRAG